MSYRTIRDAQQAVWPAVQASLERHRASRELIKADPRGATAAARTRANRPWNRVVSEETVWAIAKADLLNSKEQADVLAAAKEWARSWEDEPPAPGRDDVEDIRLYRAVQALVASPEITIDG